LHSINYDKKNSDWIYNIIQGPNPNISNFSAFYDYNSDIVFIFGGKDSVNQYHNMLYSFNLKNNSFNLIIAKEILPSKRIDSLLFKKDDLLYLYGGYDSENYFDFQSLWIFAQLEEIMVDFE
jgi:hypothetical protein